MALTTEARIQTRYCTKVQVPEVGVSLPPALLNEIVVTTDTQEMFVGGSDGKLKPVKIVGLDLSLTTEQPTGNVDTSTGKLEYIKFIKIMGSAVGTLNANGGKFTRMVPENPDSNIDQSFTYVSNAGTYPSRSILHVGTPLYTVVGASSWQFFITLTQVSNSNSYIEIMNYGTANAVLTDNTVFKTALKYFK